ncbi:MAG: hypothetical protein PHH08_03785 [Candidatus ainarchaeum sp.]|nr:hypothetical protein [Candidatus ainarchaeum sp.]
MGAYIDGVIDSFRHSFNTGYLGYVLLVSLVSALAIFVLLGIFGLIAVAAASSILGADLFALFSQAIASGSNASAVQAFLLGRLSDPAVFAGLAAATGILLAVFAVVSVLVQAFFEGIFYSIARQFMNKGAGDFGKAVSLSRKRLFDLFKARLAVGIFVLILALVIFSPALAMLPQAIAQAGNFSAAAAANPGIASEMPPALEAFMNLFNALQMVFSIVLFLLSPFLVVIGPIVVFEEKGAVDSIKRAVEITKGKLLSSLGFELLLALLSVVAGIIFAVILVFFIVIAVFFWPILFLLLLALVAFIAWAVALEIAANVKLFEINSGSRTMHAAQSTGYIGTIRR